MIKLFSKSIMAVLAFSIVSVGYAQNRKIYKVFASKRAGAFTPEQEMAGFELADGFVIELVASEKHGIVNPIDLTFDDHGRLWTQTANMYPLDPISGQSWGATLKLMKDPELLNKRMTPKQRENYKDIQAKYKLERKGTDKILIMDKPTAKISDQTPPLKVWMDGLTIPQSIMPYKNGAYLAHGSELFFVEDSNKDGKADKHRTVLSGFGIFDTHTMAHSLVRGPGGWINFSHGALNSGDVKVIKSGKVTNVTYAKNLRFNLDETDLEIIGIVRDNNWGYQVKANGQWYNTSANDNGLSILPMEDHWGIQGIGGQKMKPYQPLIKAVHDFRVIGTGISGLAFSEDGAAGFPKEYENVAFLANPITHAINCVKIHRDASGKIHAKVLPNLLSIKKEGGDDWFRPVNLEMGPDGCLYIADWYNKIIGHNEVRTDHPDRDRTHGRIWRIRHKSQKPFAIPNVGSAKTSALIQHLTKGRTLWEKRAAWHQIVDRKATELIPELKKIAQDSATPKDVKILAMWSLEGLRKFDEALIASLIASEDGDIRREAIRSLATYKAPAATVAKLIAANIEDKNVMVRSQALRTLEEIKNANADTISLLIQACKPGAPNNKFGGNYERNFERFLARKALETYPKQLKDFLSSKDASKHPSDNILWAIQALPEKERIALFISNWKKVADGEIDKDTLITVSQMLHNKDLKAVVEPTFKKRSDYLLKLALENYQFVNGAAISQFYTGKFQKSLESKSELEFSKALKSVTKLNSPHHRAILVKTLKENKFPALNATILNGILIGSPVPGNLYKELVVNKKYDFNTRLLALAAYAIKNQNDAKKLAVQFLSKASDREKEDAVYLLSNTKQGSQSLIELAKKKALTEKHFDYDSAHRLNGHFRKNKLVQNIFKAHDKIEKADRASRKAKIKRLMTDLPKLKGNADHGAALYQVCLNCHQAKQKGYQVGPPIDGLGNKNLESILTLVIDPEDSASGAYVIHSVVRKDGSVVEGLLNKKDKTGILLKQAGGIKVFIPQAQVLADRSVNKRSFMWRNLNSFTDQTYADLVEYLKKELK